MRPVNSQGTQRLFSTHWRNLLVRAVFCQRCQLEGESFRELTRSLMEIFDHWSRKETSVIVNKDKMLSEALSENVKTDTFDVN